MKVAYYPGCSLKSTAKNFEESAVASLQNLGVQMQELSRWNCCGTVFSLASDDLMHHVAPIRVLLRAQEGDSNSLIILCSMCYHTLKLSNIRVKQNPEELEKLNNLMYKEETTYEGKVTVHHLLTFLKEEIGFEKIKERIKVDLSGLKIAPYYGCLLLRPKEVSIDPNMENPLIMSEFIQALGAVPVEFAHKTECCGAYLTVGNKDLVTERAYEILEATRRRGTEMILTSCPLCQFNLDDRQREIKKKYPEFEEVPVLYFTQALGLSMGLDQQVLRFDLNWVSPLALLEEKHIFANR
ncbi:MAG: CoB--CoM heterodisulfide reductase iron-sulfur subunit B family protein [Candidatus Omnitrophota bacterium]|nr:MAG: CoB--CoM heterodisulfide reductase iron-sulfur subunit B family protein [Candidatus Omnitrophota bacterium]